jgi:ribosome biogenesis GTPase / thiamine phosphate phosphatase
MHSASSLETTLQIGLVIRKNRGQYLVQTGTGQIPCGLSSRLHKQLVYPTAAPSSRHHRVQSVEEINVVDPIAIGDQVQFLDAQDGSGMIIQVMPRRNQLSRKASGDIPLEQVLVANADQVVIVFAAAQPAPKWALLDRYLVSAEVAGLPVLIAITKMDLAHGDDLNAPLEIYSGLGYPSIITSSSSKFGIQEFRSALVGKISILMGKSGVGKTSLLNAIQPGLGLKVSAVGQESGKGKHTTTHLELFPLAGGGGVIDTPGMREFALWGTGDRELAACFPEMRPYLGRCRFNGSCRHESEPGCAIRLAVEKGGIQPNRYDSYLKLSKELSA